MISVHHFQGRKAFWMIGCVIVVKMLVRDEPSFCQLLSHFRCTQGFQHAQAVEHCGDARMPENLQDAIYLLAMISKSWQVSCWGPFSCIIWWFLKIWSTAAKPSDLKNHHQASLILLPSDVARSFLVPFFKVWDFEEIWIQKMTWSPTVT